MNKRKIIQKICEIVGQFNEEHEWTDEHQFLSEIKSKCEKFAVKYDFLDKYEVELKLCNINHREFIKVDDRYACIDIYRIKGDDRQYICNSAKQPNNELLMCYRHSTGSYMFGGGGFCGDNYYDSELFGMYFEELKKYKYSYIDEINHSIYFTVDEGMELYKNYKDICEKYQKLFNERRKQAKANELRKQLQELENGDSNENN